MMMMILANARVIGRGDRQGDDPHLDRPLQEGLPWQPPGIPRARSRSRSHSMSSTSSTPQGHVMGDAQGRLYPTPQSDRVEQSNRRFGAALPRNWQTAWRLRQRQSPPRFLETMDDTVQRWERQGSISIQIRVMEAVTSRYVWISFPDRDRTLTPADLELMMINHWYAGRGARFLFIDSEGNILRHSEPLADARLWGLTAHPALPLGGNPEPPDPVQQALQTLRARHPDILSAKIIRTLLRAQPQVTRRINASPGDPSKQRALILSAATPRRSRSIARCQATATTCTAACGEFEC